MEPIYPEPRGPRVLPVGELVPLVRDVRPLWAVSWELWALPVGLHETLEHVEDVHQAMKEIHRVLKTRRYGNHVVCNELPDPRLSGRLLEAYSEGI
jgi:hypothetical protein